MAKIKALSIKQVLTRMTIIIEGQVADVILPPLMAIVGRMVTEASKDPRLAQYMYRHLSMAKSNLEVLTVGITPPVVSEEPALDESFKLVVDAPVDQPSEVCTDAQPVSQPVASASPVKPYVAVSSNYD